jgi:predicted Zn-dependent protease
MTRGADGLARSSKPTIVMVPFGNYDLERFRDSLEAAALIFGLEPRLSLDAISIPSKTSEDERQRKQIEAMGAIRTAREGLKQLEEKWNCALMVTNYDIFATGTNYFFGLASPSERVAILSTARLTLWEEGITPSRINERILKEAAHEIGHLGKLTHCQTETCLMSYAESVDRVDAKLPLLCDGCKRKLKTEGR